MRFRSIAMFACAISVAACAAVLGLPDPTLDDTIPPGGGSSSSSGNASSSGSSGGDGSSDLDATLDGPTTDGGTDGGSSLLCVAATTWGAPKPIAGFGSNLEESLPSLTADELTMYYVHTGGLESHIGYATRDAATQPFRPPVDVVLDRPITNAPCITDDGRRLFFTDTADQTSSKSFSAPHVDGGLFGASSDVVGVGVGGGARALCRTLLFDAGTMYYALEIGPAQQGQSFLHKAVFDSTTNAWDAAVPRQPPVPEAGSYGAPVVRSDELEIFFSATVGGVTRIWTSRRATVNDAWGAPSEVTELQAGTTGTNVPGWLSKDGCRLYFSSNRLNNTLDLFVSERPSAPK